MGLPEFTADGVLPAGDYELSIDELGTSFLLAGPAGRQHWVASWRAEGQGHRQAWRSRMIRTEGEYREARRRLEAERARLQEYARQFKEMNLDSEQQKRALDPLQVFHEQLVDEIDEYERYKRGEFGELENLEGLGRWLVGARIASGLSQRAFANKLSIHESQVSRDERNEYHGVTVERAARLLQALGVVVRSTLDRVDTQQLRSVTAAHRRARVQVRETRLTTQAASFRPSPNDLIHEEVE